jgi:hypothetical protein
MLSLISLLIALTTLSFSFSFATIVVFNSEEELNMPRPAAASDIAWLSILMLACCFPVERLVSEPLTAENCPPVDEEVLPGPANEYGLFSLE